MTPLRVGSLIRAARVEVRLRQQDLADRAGVSRSKVSRIERGDLRSVRWPELDRVAAVVEVRVDLAATWRGSGGARLVDRGHAAIVEMLSRSLSKLGWLLTIEYTFNHYGDRGSVDILAWHAATRSLLLIEVKTLIADVQGLLSSMSRKLRVVPALVARERGWDARSVGQILVVRGSRAARDAIARHEATFNSALPHRTVDARRWLAAPSGSIAAVMFVADAPIRNVTHRPGPPRRVRKPDLGRHRA